ncbi:MAG: hypothetical protein AAGN35_17880 [Bacteroidota bacterium]
MRILFIVVGIIALLGVAGGSLLLSTRNGNEAKGMAQIESEMGALGNLATKMAENLTGGELPSKGAWQTAQIFSYFVLLVALFGIVALFLKGRIPMIAAGAVALFSILLWILQPSIDAGPLGGANPKTIALILMVMGIVGAACVFGVYNANQKKATLA